MDWRDQSAVYKKIWEMQCDFWGKEGNPMRHDSCNKKWQHIADGQKWAWIILHLNANGGMQHINKLDFQVEITVWTDTVLSNLRVVIFWLDPEVFTCHNSVNNDWSGPQRQLLAAIYNQCPKCYNNEGGLLEE